MVPLSVRDRTVAIQYKTSSGILGIESHLSVGRIIPEPEPRLIVSCSVLTAFLPYHHSRRIGGSHPYRYGVITIRKVQRIVVRYHPTTGPGKGSRFSGCPGPVGTVKRWRLALHLRRQCICRQIRYVPVKRNQQRKIGVV